MAAKDRDRGSAASLVRDRTGKARYRRPVELGGLGGESGSVFVLASVCEFEREDRGVCGQAPCDKAAVMRACGKRCV